MSEQQSSALVKKDKSTTFIPFGGQDELTLTISMVKSIIAVPTKSKKYPTDGDCIKFIALCKARRLNPFEGDAFLIGYDSKDGPKFNLITAHQAFLKRAEASEDFDGMESGIIISREGKVIDLQGDFFMDGDLILGGWATVHFKKKKIPMHKRIRLKRFDKGWGTWEDDPAGMICKCAEADALRSSFPTVLGGMYLKQELEKKDDQGLVEASEPLFAGTTVELEAETTEQLPPVKVDAASLRELCKRDSITEADLIDFADSIALCDKTKIKTIDKLSQQSIATLIGQWDEFQNKIKEVLGA